MADAPMKRIWIQGYYLDYLESDYDDGVKYLRDDLQKEELAVFFDQARLKGHAAFENEHEKNFEIRYNGGVYTLVRR